MNRSMGGRMFSPEREDYRAWHLTGRGFENLRAVRLPRPEIGPDELLLHQRVATICYSSIKVLMLGEGHPRLVGRDLAGEPVVLGDECYGVLAQVGDDLCGRFSVGEHVAVSPDLDVDAYGYGVPGALQQLNVIRGKMLDFLLKVPPEAVAKYGMFAMPLSEPLGCVERALALGYRAGPAPDGKMFIWADARADRFRMGKLEHPPSRVLVYEPDGPVKVVRKELARRNISMAEVSDPAVVSGPFEDVLVVSSRPDVICGAVEWATPHLARFGVLALLGRPDAGCRISVDLGRTHYDRTRVVGSDSADVADAFTRNTAFGLVAGSSVLLMGAGGPMGQFFLMRALAERDAKPSRVLAAEILPTRVENLRRMLSRIDTDIDVSVLDVSAEPTRHAPEVTGIDHLVLLCADIGALEKWLGALNDNAVVNAFAGLKGAMLSIDAADVCSRGVRVIGHSGVNLDFQQRTLAKIISGEVNVAPVVAAVGGFDAIGRALEASRDGTYPGKIAVYLDTDGPLTPVASMTDGAPWSAEAERAFLTRT